jgi:hypothetical protein
MISVALMTSSKLLPPNVRYMPFSLEKEKEMKGEDKKKVMAPM